MKFHFLVILIFSFFSGRAQNSSLGAYAEDLLFYSDIMVNAESEVHRLRAHENFRDALDKSLGTENSFALKLESIPYITSLVAPDSSFKIFTYSIADNQDVSTDFGIVQKSDGTLYTLEPETYLDDIEYEKLDASRWVSGIYYHMVPFENNNKKYYVLFGYSQPTAFSKRKVLEIFHWEDGKPVFGEELFITKQQDARDLKHSRKIYNYSADVGMVIQNDKEFNAIVIDHLMEVKSRIPGSSGNTLVPDGTYTSYKLSNGEWIYKDKLFEEKDVQGVEEKPSGEPRSGLFIKKGN